MNSEKVRSRGNIRSPLTAVLVSHQTSVFMVDARHKTFVRLYEKFDKVQTELESDLD